MYKDVMSMVKMILLSPEKLKLGNISSAWLLSLIYEGSDWTMGVMTLSKPSKLLQSCRKVLVIAKEKEGFKCLEIEFL